jgi:hypothetical protein
VITLKLVHITFPFEYAGAIERLLDGQPITEYVRYPLVDAKDDEGKHFGSQVFPGNAAVVVAQIEERDVDALFDALRTFRDEKPAHRTLRAVVLPIERRL